MSQTRGVKVSNLPRLLGELANLTILNQPPRPQTSNIITNQSLSYLPIDLKEYFPN